MIDISFWNILWTAVNLLILYLFAKKFLFGRILKIMEERKKHINGQFEEADKKSRMPSNSKRSMRICLKALTRSVMR